MRRIWVLYWRSDNHVEGVGAVGTELAAFAENMTIAKLGA
jgi:hypothetical protein